MIGEPDGHFYWAILRLEKYVYTNICPILVHIGQNEQLSTFDVVAVFFYCRLRQTKKKSQHQLVKVWIWWSFMFWSFLVFLQTFLAVAAGQPIEFFFSSLLKAVVQTCSYYIKDDVSCEKKWTKLILQNREKVSDNLFIHYPPSESPGALTERSLLRPHKPTAHLLMNSLTNPPPLSRCEAQVWIQKASPAF